MRSIRAIANFPRSLPLAADDITELHAARLLLLLRHCGSGDQIHGLTKLAKLDFFVRYPGFFARVALCLGKHVVVTSDRTESAMVRYHYGPWDERYYRVLGFLEARGLIRVEKTGNTYDFSLTALGLEKAQALSKTEPFKSIVEQMKIVKKILGRKSGANLKNLVYDVFDSEVKQRKLGEMIR